MRPFIHRVVDTSTLRQLLIDLVKKIIVHTQSDGMPLHEQPYLNPNKRSYGMLYISSGRQRSVKRTVLPLQTKAQETSHGLYSANQPTMILYCLRWNT
jgi:hypothetical protein